MRLKIEVTEEFFVILQLPASKYELQRILQLPQFSISWLIYKFLSALYMTIKKFLSALYMTLKSSPPNLAHLFISSFCLRKQTFHHCWPLIIHPKSAKEPRQTNGVCRKPVWRGKFCTFDRFGNIFQSVSTMSERFRANLRPLNIRI